MLITLMGLQIEKFGFKDGLAQEFEIVDMADFYHRNIHRITTIHRTGFYQIIWFKSGNLTLSVDFQPIDIQPDTIIFLNRDVVKQLGNKNPIDGKAIVFTDAFYCKTETDVNNLRHSILFNDLFSVSKIEVKQKPELFENLFSQMENELKLPNDQLRYSILKNLLDNFLLNAERLKRAENLTEIKSKAELDTVLTFKSLLDDNFKDQKKVSFYADKMQITEKKLNKSTKTVVGKTPKGMIDDRLILETKRILAHSTKSIKEIGYSFGFDEPTNFVKYFKKHSSYTPAEFREKHQQA